MSGPSVPDLSSMVPDYSTVTTAILAIAAVVASVIVVQVGVRWVYRVLGGSDVAGSVEDQIREQRDNE